jgi:hypothetical protein
MSELLSHEDWASEQLATAKFGHGARVKRAIAMLGRAVQAPGGRLSDVFTTPAELEGAYDFVEGEVRPEAITRALAEATLRAIGEAKSCFVPIDGSSLTLTDRTGKKGFGSVGKKQLPTRGLKVIDAIAVAMDGTPVGLLDLHWWARGSKANASRYVRRTTGQTETRHWVEAVDEVSDLFGKNAPHCTPWFLGDRECDNTAILQAVAQPGRTFTIRSVQNRPVRLAGAGRRPLRDHMKRSPVGGRYIVNVAGGPRRRARRAVLEMRFADVVLDLPDRATNKRIAFPVRVVWAHEWWPPRGEAALDWMLFTNREVTTFEEATAIVFSYCQRWRVEDFHKAWKSGHCNVEDTQLREMNHVLRWAPMLAAIAMRVERLKHLARTQPELPASAELSEIEVDALRAAKTRIKKRTETIPTGMPSIGQAVRWIAELGGYTGKSSGGPPGSITIARGFERLLIWADAFACAREQKRRRK